MPKKIQPRSIGALTANINYVNPRGYWRKLAQIFGPVKRKMTDDSSALSKFYSGTYSPGIQVVENYEMNNKKTISEEIHRIIKNDANKHVNKFMRSDDGKALRKEVAQIVRMKIAKKNV